MFLKFIQRFLPGAGAVLSLRSGDLAPQFECGDQHGQRVSSQDLKGQRYLLWFYPKASTGG
ncbi:MAG: peroxiredoxin Q/BCP [Candidatus Paceibacteria bacterium]|jgi:peroxiredoxin Q/BCP